MSVLFALNGWASFEESSTKAIALVCCAGPLAGGWLVAFAMILTRGRSRHRETK